jgi:5'-nucleotidase
MNESFILVDMDYTLAVYNPFVEEYIYTATMAILVGKKGYPEDLLYLKYDADFAIRGVYIDKILGNLLKIDVHGYILKCIHGRRIVQDVDSIYPERFILINDIGKRYHVIDTSYSLPELCLYADLVEYFSHSEDGVQLSYWGIFEDLRSTLNLVHAGPLKETILKDPETFLRKDGKVPLLLERLKKMGKKTFLMTNSDYNYSSGVLKYILGPNWKDYFDIIIVSAQKPNFFGEGTTLREVDEENGLLKLTNVSSRTEFEKGRVYNGGNLEIFKKLSKTQGREVLYCGDNINHDIVTSKENRCLWRTLLVVKELDREIEIWQNSSKQYKHLINLEYIRSKMFFNMNSSTTLPLEAEEMEMLREKIHECIVDFDSFFNPYFGSLFRSGSSESAYTSQVMKFADLYSSDATNLLNYPFFYYFSHQAKLYPHEFDMDEPAAGSI